MTVVAVAPISFEAAADLVDIYLQDGFDPPFSPPLALGKDLHDRLGEDGEILWRELMEEYEAPYFADDVPAEKTLVGEMNQNREIVWREYRPGDFSCGDRRLDGDPRSLCSRAEWREHLDWLWSTYATRERGPHDVLLIDAIMQAAENDWHIQETAENKPTIDAMREIRMREMTNMFQRRANESIIHPAPTGTPMPAPNLSVVPAAPLPDLMTSAAKFVAGFAPPDYLIDGFIQRRYLYSLTAKTGVGKTAIAMRWMAHVASGRPLGDRDVQQGVVIYMAGENPDDVRARWLALSQSMGMDPAIENAIFIVGTQGGLPNILSRINQEVTTKGLNVAMVVIDTGAAFFVGDNDNDNTQMGNYARSMRALTELPGGPCVLALMHPTKNAADDDLVPRGGGAFINEVDGNLAVRKKESLLVVSPHGKYRGDMSVTLRYELDVVRDHPLLKDTRGRPIPSVLVRPIADVAAATMEKTVDRDTEMVLDAVHRNPNSSPSDLARALDWKFGMRQEPNVNRVKRNLTRLQTEKLVTEKLGRWRTTSQGEKELNFIEIGQTTSVPLPLHMQPRAP